MILLKDFARTVQRTGHNSVIPSVWFSSEFEKILASFLIVSSFYSLLGDFLISFVITYVVSRAFFIISLFLMASPTAKLREYV